MNLKFGRSWFKVKTNSASWSVLIPTYMENENLPILIKLLEESLSQRKLEVILIDDGSSDGITQTIRKLSERHGNLTLLVRSRKMGLGSAYKDGFKASSGEVIVEMDADLSHNPKELPKLFKALNHADVVIGSRYIHGGKTISRKWYRRLLSRGASLLANLFLGLGVRDATSGFRAYKRKAFEGIASKSSLNGFEFQVEALHIAKKLKLKVAEVPITFIDRKRGKSKLGLKDAVTFAKSIMKMAFRL